MNPKMLLTCADLIFFGVRFDDRQTATVHLAQLNEPLVPVIMVTLCSASSIEYRVKPPFEIANVDVEPVVHYAIYGLSMHVADAVAFGGTAASILMKAAS